MATADPLERITLLGDEARKVLDALYEITEMLSQYNLTGLSKWDWTKVLGVKLEWGKRDQDLPAGEMPIGQAVYTIKAKIKKVRERYIRTFPEELVYLSQERLNNFECLPAIGLLNNPDVVDSVFKAQAAMEKRLQEIDKKAEQLYRKVTDTPANNRASEAFSSLESVRVIDAISKEEQIIRDYDLKQFQELQKEKKEMARYTYALTAGGATNTPLALNTVVMGLTPAPVGKVSKMVSDFNNWLLAKQAPLSSNFCDRRRVALTAEQVTQARIQGAEDAEKLDRAAEGNKVYKKGLGREALASPEFKLLQNRYSRSLKWHLEDDKIRKSAFLINKFASLKKSLAGCETSEGVKKYVNEMEKVVAELTALKDEKPPSVG